MTVCQLNFPYSLPKRSRRNTCLSERRFSRQKIKREKKFSNLELLHAKVSVFTFHLLNIETIILFYSEKTFRTKWKPYYIQLHKDYKLVFKENERVCLFVCLFVCFLFVFLFFCCCCFLFFCCCLFVFFLFCFFFFLFLFVCLFFFFFFVFLFIRNRINRCHFVLKKTLKVYVLTGNSY